MLQDSKAGGGSPEPGLDLGCIIIRSTADKKPRIPSPHTYYPPSPPGGWPLIPSHPLFPHPSRLARAQFQERRKDEDTRGEGRYVPDPCTLDNSSRGHPPIDHLPDLPDLLPRPAPHRIALLMQARQIRGSLIKSSAGGGEAFARARPHSMISRTWPPLRARTKTHVVGSQCLLVFLLLLLFLFLCVVHVWHTQSWLSIKDTTVLT